MKGRYYGHKAAEIQRRFIHLANGKIVGCKNKIFLVELTSDDDYYDYDNSSDGLWWSFPHNNEGVKNRLGHVKCVFIRFLKWESH